MAEPEQVVLLDAAGQPSGTADKATVHHAATPYHLAFSSYAFRRDGRLLVTRRSLTKRTWPGVWSNSCCGHPFPGEPLIDAVRRRFLQELGADAVGVQVALAEFAYTAADGDVMENELCPVVLCWVDDRPRPDPAEVADHAWLDWSTFVTVSCCWPAALSPWARLQVAELEVGALVEQFLLSNHED